MLDATARALRVDVQSLHTTSRLDREVSGVVLIARSEAARAHLARARETGRYLRRYLALASPAALPEEGVWDAPIGRTRDARLRAANGSDAAAAESRFSVVARAPRATLLALEPITGRTLARALAIHPWMTAKVIGAIYWEALKLWAKGFQYYAHGKPISQTME